MIIYTKDCCSSVCYQYGLMLNEIIHKWVEKLEKQGSVKPCKDFQRMILKLI